MGYNYHRAFKTAALISSWICMGLFSEVSSPTLPYLKKRVNCNYEEISRVLVARSVGFLLGSIGSGIVGYRFPRLNDLWLALALFMAGGATIAAPWCPNLPLVAAMFCLDGAGKGIICVVASTSVMMLWKEKAAVPTHSLHFSFGIGALIAPQAARPFLPRRSVHDNDGHDITGNQTFTYDSSVNGTINLYVNGTNPNNNVDSEERIEIVYAIMGGITILTGLIFLYFQLTSKQSEDQDRPMVKKRTDTEDRVCRKLASVCKGARIHIVAFLVLLFIFWCLPTGAERTYGKFIFAYAVDSDTQMDPITGTILVTVFWASFTAGRGLATIASKWLSPPVLLAGGIIVKIICAFLLAFLVQTNQIFLFVVTAIFGATVSPIFPATCIWANMYIEMNAAMNAFAFLSASFGAFTFSWGTGYLFQYYGYQYLMYMMVVYAGSVLLIYIALILLLRSGKLKKKSKEPELQEVNAELECM